MRIEISKLPESAKTFANVFQLLLNFTTMVLILNFIVSIICEVEKSVRTENKADDWLMYLFSKVTKLAKRPARRKRRKIEAK